MSGDLTPAPPPPDGLPDLGEDRMDLDLATTAVLARDEDQPMLVAMLADQLAANLGDQVAVEREGGGMFRKKSSAVKSLEVVFGADTFRAEVARGRVGCSIGHTSGGIRIRTEAVELDEWVKRLLGALRSEAARSQKVRSALEGLVYGGYA